MRVLLVSLVLASLMLAQERDSVALNAPVMFLVKTQLRSGAWPDRPGGEPDVSATSLSVVALMSADHIPRRNNPPGVALRRGLDYLVRLDGKFGESTLAHAQATVALCEAWARTRNSRYRKPAKAALLALLKRQHPDKAFGDLAATGWGALALVSAHRADIPVPAGRCRALRRWLVKAKRDTTRATAVCASLAAISSQVDARFHLDVSSLCARPPFWERSDPVAAYFGTLAARHQGEVSWKRWSATLLDQKQTAQRRDGSWRASPGFGPVSSTAYGILCQAVRLRFPAVVGRVFGQPAPSTGTQSGAPIRANGSRDGESMEKQPFVGPPHNAAIGLGGSERVGPPPPDLPEATP